MPYTTDASFWRSSLTDLDDARTTPELPESVDIVIIGAGYAGAATAYHLVKGEGSEHTPKQSIAILEARGACSGATGRNGERGEGRMSCTSLTYSQAVIFVPISTATSPCTLRDSASSPPSSLRNSK